MRILLLLLAVGISLGGSGQVLSGTVRDSVGKAIPGAVVTICADKDWSVKAFGFTDQSGFFKLVVPADKPNDLVRMRTGYQGYRSDTLLLPLPSKESIDIVLRPLIQELEEVVVKAELPIVVRGDTTTFAAAGFSEADDRKLGDILKKMPGFKVEQNGRLSFNGKEVEKLFIDGDDLAGEHYGLLTGQLDAFLVDKVDVVDQFVENRLMQGIQKSDKVGVNIRLKDAYKMRLSGSAEWGRAMSGQQEYSVTGTLIREKLKWLVFHSGNNTGQDLGSQFPESFTTGAGGESWRSFGFPDDRLYAGEAASISLPPLGDRYTKRNRDAGTVSMASWKQGEHVKISFQTGLMQTNLVASLKHASELRIPDVKSWRTEGDEIRLDRTQRFFSTIRYLRDKGKNRNSSVVLSFGNGSLRQRYSNELKGDVVDSLREKWWDKNGWYSGEWIQTRKTGAAKVLQAICRIEGRSGDQHVDAYTYRLHEYLGMDSSVRLFRQKGNRNYFLAESNIRVHRRNQSSQMEYGWRTAWLKGDAQHTLEGFSISDQLSTPLRQDSMPIGTLTSVMYYRNSRTFLRMFTLDFEGNGGLSSLAGTRIRPSILPVWNAKWMIKRSFSRKATLGLIYQWSRSFAQSWLLMPDGQLSGNRVILNGLNPSGTEARHSGQLIFRSLNVFRQRQWFLSFLYLFQDKAYGSVQFWQPAYTVKGFERYQHAGSWQALMKHSLFVRMFKTKWLLDLQWLDRWGPVRVNGLLATQRQQLFKMENRLVTGFKRRWNGEFNGGMSVGTFTRASVGPAPNWQWTAAFKVKWKATDRIYAAGTWKWQQLSPQRGFQSADIYVLGKKGERFHWRLECVNLLNQRRVDQRQVSAFEESITSFFLNGRYLLFALSYRF
jgi:hypothetical protein